MTLFTWWCVCGSHAWRLGDRFPWSAQIRCTPAPHPPSTLSSLVKPSLALLNIARPKNWEESSSKSQLFGGRTPNALKHGHSASTQPPEGIFKKISRACFRTSASIPQPWRQKWHPWYWLSRPSLLMRPRFTIHSFYVKDSKLSHLVTFFSSVFSLPEEKTVVIHLKLKWDTLRFSWC